MRTLIITSFFLFSNLLFAQIGLNRVEAYYGGGYTAFDIDEWVGPILNDWDQANYGGHASIFLFSAGPVDLGVQAGYQDLFFYSTEQDLGFGTPIRREFYIGATQLLLVGQVGGESGFFGEGVAGIYSGDFVSGPAVGAGGGYRIKINNFGIPIKLRADAILEDQTLLVLAGYLGFSYQF